MTTETPDITDTEQQQIKALVEQPPCHPASVAARVLRILWSGSYAPDVKVRKIKKALRPLDDIPRTKVLRNVTAILNIES